MTDNYAPATCVHVNTWKGKPVMIARALNPPDILSISGDGARMGEWTAFLTPDQARDLAEELILYAAAAEGKIVS